MPETGDHATCAEQLRVGMHPSEITISTEPPLIRGTYTTDGFRCPHGVTYWIEPTSEQIAKWRAEAAGEKE